MACHSGDAEEGVAAQSTAAFVVTVVMPACSRYSAKSISTRPCVPSLKPRERRMAR